MRGLLKGLFSLWLLFLGLFGSCGAVDYTFSVPFVYSSKSVSFSSSSNIVYSVASVWQATVDKYFCDSSALYWQYTNTANDRIWTWYVFNCMSSKWLTTDLFDESDCTLLLTLTKVSTAWDYRDLPYYCFKVNYNNDWISYFYVQRAYTGSVSQSTQRNFYDYSMVVSFDSLFSNSSLLSDNNLLTQSSCNSQYAWYITQSACNSQYSWYIQPSDCPSCSSCPVYTYYTPNWTWIINWDFIVRNIDNNYITTELRDLWDGAVWLDLYFNSNSIDHNYCENNNLCPIYTWDSWSCNNSWDVSRSSVYINDIQHLWWPNINISIPEEISWDYDYNVNNDMSIDIEWYNVDYDKINWIVDIQKYKPTSDDFTRLVSESVPLFVPWLVIILLVYFIFRFVKKIF